MSSILGLLPFLWHSCLSINNINLVMFGGFLLSLDSLSLSGFIVLIYLLSEISLFHASTPKPLYNTVLDITRFKGNSQKCIDYKEK